MITVCFYGDLSRFGRRFDLQAETPAEALHALFVQIGGLREHIRNGVYQVRFGGEDQTEAGIAEAFRRPASGILHIVPRVRGAGKNGGLIQTVVGAVLIVVGAITYAYGGASLVAAGIGMVAGGVAQMLTKPPKMKEFSGADAGRNSAFSNLGNTTAQGRPMPLAYGRVYAGSRVVSQGVESRRLNGAAAEHPAGSLWRVLAKSRGRNPAQGGGQNQPGAPLAADLTVGLTKKFITGTAATAPNGQKYHTDFADDSVRAANYEVVLGDG